MGTISRERVIEAGTKEELWPVEDTQTWRDAAQKFINDHEGQVRRMSGAIPRFHYTPTSGKALVDLLIQAHLGDAGDQYTRMSKQNAERFNVKRAAFKKRRSRSRASADEGISCQGTTREGNRCRNPGKYDGFCWLHAPKCEFYEVSGEISKRCPFRAVDDKLCSNHAHHRDDLREELMDNAAVCIQRHIRGHLTRKRVPNTAPPNELCNSPGGSCEVISPVDTSITPSPSRKPCKGKKKSGEDCGALAVKGTDYCRHHQDQGTGVTDAKMDEKEESRHGGSTPPIESAAERSELVEPSTVDGGSTLPSNNARPTCRGKSRITGRNCGRHPGKKSAYCHLHEDQDPCYQTEKLADKFSQIRTVDKQKDALDILPDIDEYAVATYMLMRKSNNRASKLVSTLGLGKEKTRRVDLTIYPSGVIFLYPDELDKNDGKLLGKLKLENINVDIKKVPDGRTLRFKYTGKTGAAQNDFVKVNNDTANEIKAIVDALKVKKVEEARKLAEESHRKEPPYHRWLDQIKDMHNNDPESDLRAILYDRNGQLDNELENGFVEELDEDGKTAIFWWGASRNKRTGRKIGNEEQKRNFCKEMRELFGKELTDDSDQRVTSKPPDLTSGTSRSANPPSQIPQSDPPMEETLNIPKPSHPDWFKEWFEECEEKAKNEGQPGDLEYQRKLTDLLFKKFFMDRKVSRDDRKRERLISPLDKFHKDGVYYWDGGCKDLPIGRDLVPFSKALEKIFPDHYVPAKDATREGKYIHSEKSRPAWSSKVKNDSWEKLRNPTNGVLFQAFEKAFDSVPEFVNDQSMSDSEFRVDMYGNVVAKPGTAEQFSVCCTQYDHVLPWSRGGTSKSENIEVISWIANQMKLDYFLHGTDYVQGWEQLGNRPLNIGLSIDQFISLWVDVRDSIQRMTDNKQVRPAALRNHKLGKKLVEGILFKTCAMENSWKLFQAILAGGITNANGEFEQILKRPSGAPERPTGELLRRLLERFSIKFSSKETKTEAREIMEGRAKRDESVPDKVRRLRRELAEAEAMMEAQAEMKREAVIIYST